MTPFLNGFSDELTKLAQNPAYPSPSLHNGPPDPTVPNFNSPPPAPQASATKPAGQQRSAPRKSKKDYTDPSVMGERMPGESPADFMERRYSFPKNRHGTEKPPVDPYNAEPAAAISKRLPPHILAATGGVNSPVKTTYDTAAEAAVAKQKRDWETGKSDREKNPNWPRWAAPPNYTPGASE